MIISVQSVKCVLLGRTQKCSGSNNRVIRRFTKTLTKELRKYTLSIDEFLFWHAVHSQGPHSRVCGTPQFDAQTALGIKLMPLAIDAVGADDRQ